jgi:hypothetical protein
MESLSDYKIVMDYAAQEVKNHEGSKISCPEEYEIAQKNYKIARTSFINRMNDFSEKFISSGLKFPQKD